MVMRRRPVGRERPGERLALRGGMPERVVRPGRSAWSVAATAVLAAMASGAAIPAVASADPPPDRAYERVSPADKPSGAVAGMSSEAMAMPGRAADVGERVVYGASSTVSGSWSGPANPMVFGERTATGWRSRTAIRSGDQGDTPLELVAHEVRAGWMTRDGSELVFGAGKPFGWSTPTPLPGVFRTRDAATAPEWLSEPRGGHSVAAGVAHLTVTTGDDTRTVAFQSTVPLTADAPPTGTPGVYVYRNGSLQLASVVGGSVPVGGGYFANNGGTGSGSATSPPARVIRNQLAVGGRFLLFVDGTNSGTGGGALYVRDLDRGVTHQLAGGGGGAPDVVSPLRDGWGVGGAPISVDQQTVPDGLVFAARDAPRAFFHTGQPTGVRHAYEANLETGDVVPRPEITGPPVGLSADGTRMLFLELPANGTRLGDWTLRYWDAADPATSVAVGTISVSSPGGNGFAQVYEPSADGRTWVFLAAGSLDPARPNTAPLTRQLYRWQVGSGAPTCLSCNSTDGVARTSGANLSVQESVTSESFLTPTVPIAASANQSKPALAQPSHGASDDGRWILFDSPDRLVAEDTNDVRDVYLWDRDGGSGGSLHLVSSGQGVSPSWALDLSPDGVNAFFTTRDGMVPGDNDGAYDVYTARVDGGFPGSPESCVGEACRPPVMNRLPVVAPGSPLVAPVSVGRQKLLKPEKRKLKLRVRRGKATSKRVTLKVRTPGAGKVRVRGKGLRKARKTAKRSSTYTVKVALTKKSRQTLAKKGRLRLRVSVRFTPTKGNSVKKTVKWTIKRSARSSRKGR